MPSSTLVLSLEPLALCVVLAARAAADRVVLELGASCEGRYQHVSLPVRTITVEDVGVDRALARVVITHAASLEPAELVIAAHAELRFERGGRHSAVVPLVLSGATLDAVGHLKLEPAPFFVDEEHPTLPLSPQRVPACA
jgi:hypothetical protein